MLPALPGPDAIAPGAGAHVRCGVFVVTQNVLKYGSAVRGPGRRPPARERAAVVQASSSVGMSNGTWAGTLSSTRSTCRAGL